MAKQLHFILLILIMNAFVAPTHSMFTRQVPRITQTIPKTTLKPSLRTRAYHMINTSTSWVNKQFTNLKNRFSRYWYSTTPTTAHPQKKSIPSITTLASTIESNAIIDALNTDNPFDDFLNPIESPLGQRIKVFLEHNDDIEKVFTKLTSLTYFDTHYKAEYYFSPKIQYKSGCTLLTDLCTNDQSFAIKFAPLIKIIHIPQDRNNNEAYIDTLTFIYTVVHQLSTQPDINPEMIEHLKQIFFETIQAHGSFFGQELTVFSSRLYNKSPFSTMLPNNIEVAIEAIVTSCENNRNQSIIYKRLANAIAHRIRQTEQKKKDRLYVSIAKFKSFISVAVIDIMQTLSTEENSELLKAILQLTDNATQTPSWRHLQIYINYAFVYTEGFTIYYEHRRLLCPLLENELTRSMIKKCIHKEAELNDLDYETFYHGRRWAYNLMSDIYGMLFEHKSGKPLEDFIFTHLDEPVTGKIRKTFYESENKKREQLLQEGNLFADQSIPMSTDPLKEHFYFANRQQLLFLNKFLFGNTREVGSNSLYYVLNNMNQGDINFSPQEIFHMFGYTNVYRTYEKELQELTEEHKKLSRLGELLLIAIPKENVDKCVYYTTSGGPKLSMNIPGIGETTDTKLILNQINQKPVDRFECVLINTQDTYGGLNPDSGIKMFSFNAVDSENMTDFEKKKNALFIRILETIKLQEQAKRAQE